MFGANIYASKENFTQPLVVMVETFRRSAFGVPQSIEQILLVLELDLY